MSGAREIIAKAIPSTSEPVKFAVADMALHALEAAGYRLLGPDELDPRHSGEVRACGENIWGHRR